MADLIAVPAECYRQSAEAVLAGLGGNTDLGLSEITAAARLDRHGLDECAG